MPRAKKIVDETAENKGVEITAAAETATKTATKTTAKTEKKPRATKAAAKTDAPAEKKTTTRKKAVKKAEPKASVMIQVGSREAAAKEVLAAAVKAYKDANGEVEIETIEIYIKPEENAVYYVVNGDDSGNNRIDLFQ